MDFDPIVLSRIQFAFCVTFHIVFPSFTIGLAAWLATLEGLSVFTGRSVYRRLFDFWLRVFAVAFGMGVVSGIVMAFQFGTNWGVLAERTGPIQGPLLGYEAFTAFLLEATFFGVVMFGRDRVPSGVYFASCVMVALGTTLSAFWILANNSWMQVPVGHAFDGALIVPEDWWAILLSPVLWVRFPHMLLGAYLTTAFCIAATGAWYLLRSRHLSEANVMLRMGLGLAALLIPAQIVFGHLNGEYTETHQPSKFTAIEGRWQTEQPARLILFAWPDPAQERNLYEISIPALGSFVDAGNFTELEPGIVTIPEADRPPVWVPFFTFRIMVGLGVVMLILSWTGVVLMVRGSLSRRRVFLWATFFSFPAGFAAVIAGWYTAEVGRQPWVVFGLLRTEDALTSGLSGVEVLISLTAYVLIYALIFSAGTLYIYRLLRAGPADSPHPPLTHVTAKRPLAIPGQSPGLVGEQSGPGEG